MLDIAFHSLPLAALYALILVAFSDKTVHYFICLVSGTNGIDFLNWAKHALFIDCIDRVHIWTFVPRKYNRQKLDLSPKTTQKRDLAE
jgi:hypothetical protein